MKHDKHIQNPTPSQLLMECLEDFGECEPTAAVVVYTNEAGELCWQSTAITLSQKIGMLELAKQWLLARAIKS